MKRKFGKFRIIELFCVGLFSMSIVHYVVFAQQSDPSSAKDAELIMDDLNLNIHNKSHSLNLIRESTVFKNQSCEFRLSGNRALLLVDGGTRRFFCLENLNLERIVKVLHENQFMNFWTVDFVVTEYQKENYVLIQRAILNPSMQNRSKDSRPQKPDVE